MTTFAELVFHMFLFMPSTVDYRGSKLIIHDYYWLFSLYGQFHYCRLWNEMQYHGGTTLTVTVEYIHPVNPAASVFCFSKFF